MNKQIFNKFGEVAYNISDQGNAVFVYDAQGNLKYRYDRTTNMSYDASGNIVMIGNIILDLDRG